MIPYTLSNPLSLHNINIRRNILQKNTYRKEEVFYASKMQNRNHKSKCTVGCSPFNIQF